MSYRDDVGGWGDLAEVTTLEEQAEAKAHRRLHRLQGFAYGVWAATLALWWAITYYPTLNN